MTSLSPRLKPWTNRTPWSAWALQIAAALVVGAVVTAIALATQENLADRNIRTGFDFLQNRAGFAIGETLFSYAPTDSFGRALLAGLGNTLSVSAWAIVISTGLGLLIGLARLSDNALVRSVSGAYVEVVRNLPLLLQLFVWYALLLHGAPAVATLQEGNVGAFITNRGAALPTLGWEGPPLALAAAWLLVWSRGQTGARRATAWAACALLSAGAAGLAFLRYEAPVVGAFEVQGGLQLSVEFIALVVALSVYTSAYLAEIVRGGLSTVSRGQGEAAQALGLSAPQRLWHVVLPQALRIILPPMTSWHLNTVKNSSLAVAIGYPEVVSVIDTIISQTGQAVEGVLLIILVFLSTSLILSLAMNLYARRNAIWEPAAGPGTSLAPPEFHWPKWRSHLFAEPRQAALTLATAALVGLGVWAAFDWLVLQAVFVGDAADCRRAAGACWPFVQENARFILLGSYPEPEQWRPAAVIGLFAVSLLASLVRRLWGHVVPALWAITLLASPWLMAGGLGLVGVATDKWSGLPVTLLLAGNAVVGAFPLAVLLALARRSRSPVFRWIATGFIEVVRGVPLLGVLFIAAVLFPLLVPAEMTINAFLRVQIALVLFTAAYMAEAVRGGLLSLNKGQAEAGQALGLSRWAALRAIILPQALIASLPSLVSIAISEVKNTTLVLIVGVFDLLQMARLAYVPLEWRPFFVEAYLFVGLVYFTLCFALSRIAATIERAKAGSNASISRHD